MYTNTRGFVDLFVWGVTHELLACVYEASMPLISTVQAAAYYTFIGFWYSPLLWLFSLSSWAENTSMAMFSACMCAYSPSFQKHKVCIHMYLYRETERKIYFLCIAVYASMDFIIDEHTYFSKRTTKNRRRQRTWEQNWAKVNGTQSGSVQTSMILDSFL